MDEILYKENCLPPNVANSLFNDDQPEEEDEVEAETDTEVEAEADTEVEDEAAEPTAKLF